MWICNHCNSENKEENSECSNCLNKQVEALPLGEFWKAVRTFNADEADGPSPQLSFKKGDSILVSDTSNKSWWRGKFEDGIGWFPKECVVKPRKSVTDRQLSEEPSCNFQDSNLYDEVDMYYKVLKPFKGKSPYGNDIFEVRSGILVHGIGQSGEWNRIQFANNDGWIPSSHLRLISTYRLEDPVQALSTTKESDQDLLPTPLPKKTNERSDRLSELYLAPLRQKESTGELNHPPFGQRVVLSADLEEDNTYCEIDEIDPGLLQSFLVKDSSSETDLGYLRIVMLGKTGSGKSAVGNNILDYENFVSRADGQSVTKECSCGVAYYDNRKVLVVDTPGLFDTKLTPATIKENIVKCIHMSLPGPHVFLLILQIGRFTGEEIAAMNHLFEIFGESMAKCSIIVFTGLDSLEREKRTIESYIEGTGEPIQKYINRCGGRYFAINNVAESHEIRKNSIKELLTKIDDMVRQNNGSHFSNAIFSDTENTIKEAVKEVKDKELRAKTLEIAKVTRKFDMKFKSFKEEKEYIEQEIVVQNELRKTVTKKKMEATLKISKLDGIQPEDLKEDRTKDLKNLEKEEIEVYKKLQSLRIKRSYLEADCDKMNKNNMAEIKAIERNHERNMTKAIAKATNDNFRLINSLSTAIDEINIKIEAVREEMRKEENLADKEKTKSLKKEEENLLKERNKLVSKQSKYRVKVLQNSALLEKHLNKKDKMCHIM